MVQMEIGFNILYLLTIYAIVVLMARRSNSASYDNLSGSMVFLWAFVLLAIGDTGHVGFRLLAFARGGLEQNEVLVGLGALATAITITTFYMLIAEVWVKHSGAKRSGLIWLVWILGVTRFVVMAFPGNRWGQVVPPFEPSLIRNSFLTAMGIIVVYLLLRDGIRQKDRFMTRSALAIIISFACYIPVVLLVQRYPMTGMLMIPKTIAYVVLALIGYKRLFVPVGT